MGLSCRCGDFAYVEMTAVIWSTWEYLTFSVCKFYVSPAVCMSSELCTHILGTHVVLIIGPSSNETHPYPICCTPPVKIFPLICNNSLQTFLQPKRGTLCYQNRFSDYPSHSRVAWWLQRLFCNWKVTSLNLTADRLSISSSASLGGAVNTFTGIQGQKQDVLLDLANT